MQWKTLYPFHVKFIRNHRLMMLLLILLCFVCVAAQADDITQNCTFSALSKEKIFRLTDGKTAKSFEGKPYRENWIKVDPPSGKTICGLYMLWNESESEVLLDIWDAKKGDYVTYATVHTGVYLHEYLSLPGVASVRLRSTDKPGNIPLVELRVLSDGEIPDDIQIWEPPCTNADLLILVAHPDDELLFFGGTIPWYSLEKNLHVAVAYMTCKNTTRYHELLDGLWTAGIREYPHLVGLIDKSATVKMSTTYKQWGGIDVALDAVADVLNAVRPSIVLSQDLEGEYGHGAHMAVADLCLRIIRDGERELIERPKKLYLHLWEENPIQMDWEIPMADGRTSLEVAAAAFQCHESQVGFSAKMKNGKKFKFEVVAGGPLDNGRFGLAYTSVGADTLLCDFMEHVNPKER